MLWSGDNLLFGLAHVGPAYMIGLTTNDTTSVIIEHATVWKL